MVGGAVGAVELAVRGLRRVVRHDVHVVQAAGQRVVRGGERVELVGDAPGEFGGGLLTVRLRAQTAEGFTPALRRLAAAVDPMVL